MSDSLKFESIEEELEHYKNEYNELKEMCELNEEENKLLEEENKKLQEIIRKSKITDEELNKELDLKEKQINLLKSENSNLKSSFSEYKIKSIKKESELDEKISKLLLQIENLEKINKSHLQNIAMLENNIDQLDNSKRESLASLENLKVKFDNLLEEHALISEDVESQKPMLERLKQQIEEYNEETEYLKRKLKEKTEELVYVVPSPVSHTKIPHSNSSSHLHLSSNSSQQDQLSPTQNDDYQLPTNRQIFHEHTTIHNSTHDNTSMNTSLDSTMKTNSNINTTMNNHRKKKKEERGNQVETEVKQEGAQKVIVMVGGGHLNIQLLKNLSLLLPLSPDTTNNTNNNTINTINTNNNTINNNTNTNKNNKHSTVTNKDTSSYKLVLVSPSPLFYYSGMIPGCVANLYEEKQIHIDLPTLSLKCGASFITGRMEGIDREKKEIKLSDNQTIKYDLLSLNLGSLSSGEAEIEGVKEYAITTRPLSLFLSKLSDWESTFLNSFHNISNIDDNEITNNKSRQDVEEKVLRIVIVGAGEGGIEMGMALEKRYREILEKKATLLHITLIHSSSSFFSSTSTPTSTPTSTTTSTSTIHMNESNNGKGMESQFSKNIMKVMNEKKMKVMFNSTCVKVLPHHILLHNQSTVPYHLLIWATGASAPPLLKELGLSTNDKGFLMVNTNLQSIDDPCIFAGGDCVSIKGYEWVPKSAVYAIREGPILTKNIVSYVKGEKMLDYIPQKSVLSLLMTGDEKAISRYKFTSFHNNLIWTLKDKIDKDFMDLFDVNKF